MFCSRSNLGDDYWRYILHVAQLVEGTALRAGRSRVRFPMLSSEFFIDLILPAALLAMRSTQRLTEMSTRDIFWGVKAAGA
jgi:hypothetical protein